MKMNTHDPILIALHQACRHALDGGLRVGTFAIVMGHGSDSGPIAGAMRRLQPPSADVGLMLGVTSVEEARKLVAEWAPEVLTGLAGLRGRIPILKIVGERIELHSIDAPEATERAH